VELLAHYMCVSIEDKERPLSMLLGMLVAIAPMF